MTLNHPYILRALNEWLLDNGETPHLVVSATDERQVLPWDFVEDEQIILNISPSAVLHLELGNEWVSFNARFSGKPMDVLISTPSVLGIYGRESGKGMFFSDEDRGDALMSVALENEVSPPKPTKPVLKIVK